MKIRVTLPSGRLEEFDDYHVLVYMNDLRLILGSEGVLFVIIERDMGTFKYEEVKS